MQAELSILSFICAILPLSFVPSRRVRENVSHLAFIIWLFVCNVIHGVNTTLWAGNVNIHIPVWCDLGTLSSRL